MEAKPLAAAAAVQPLSEVELAADMDSPPRQQQALGTSPTRRPLPAVASLEYQRAKLAEESQLAATATGESQVARVEALRALQAGESTGGGANRGKLQHDDENNGEKDNGEDTVLIVPGESYQVLTTCRLRAGVDLNSEPVGHISTGEVVGMSLMRLVIHYHPRLPNCRIV
jgi:hypothetical protein